MSLRTSLKNLIRRDPAASLRERAAGMSGILTSQTRRAVVAGSVAAAVPLPALAAPIATAAAQPHPDAELLALAERWLRARTAQDEAMEAWGVAHRQVYAVIKTCPPELFAPRDERLCFGAGWRFPTLLGVSLRHVALDWGTPGVHTEQAWTGKALRIAIARAVPLLGRGGLTPGRIRRWKALLPIADAFDARVEAVEAETGRRHLEEARRVAEDAFRDLNREIGRHVATTPEGMAALVRVIARYPWKDTGSAWPNLLRSAANVASIDLADLDHEYDSINASRA
ncbi:hypothetical protein MKK75_13235 [Methylobacterium sp. J-030]|uniref:hypothetical protein n=1 Tax=Methylobacterium sp. J-030 TaxID=2836627 RepID=UPI001FB8CE57|nr:hypothetical protein [Methylobacterium sp. J-030]MCJ2069741.1 hypothetical protein [Methylobacterium sp. J-030]